MGKIKPPHLGKIIPPLTIFMEFMGIIEVRMHVPGEPKRQLTNINENARKIIAILWGRYETYYA
jgi:hypothetical protein